MHKSKNIFVTGGAGYIGSHTVLSLKEKGYSVIVIDDLSSGHKELLPSDVPLIIGNAGNPTLIEKAIKEYKPEAIFHFAGSIDATESILKPEKYFENNFSVSKSLIETCISNNLNNFIFSSTAAVYGIGENSPLAEDHKLEPINPYGESKLLVEKFLEKISSKSKLKYISLRYFNVAGADPKGRTGEITTKATHLIEIASEVIAGKRDKLMVFGTDYDTPDGTCIRDYIHVSDLANAHIAALSDLMKNKKNRIMNCGYGRGFSVLEIIKTIIKISKSDIIVESAPRRAGDAVTLIANTRKIMETLDWEPKHDSIKEIVGSAIAWEKNNIFK